MNLPFGLNQKPLSHYFDHGVIRFSVKEGTLYYKIKIISKQINGDLEKGIVKDKSHLDKLLSIKSYGELMTLVTDGLSKEYES